MDYLIPTHNRPNSNASFTLTFDEKVDLGL